MKMATDKLRFLETEDSNRAADAQALAAHMLSLSDARIVASGCSYDEMLAAGFTLAEVGKLTKFLKGYIDQGIFEDLWAKAHQAGVVGSSVEMNFQGMSTFKTWMSKKAGQLALSFVQQKAKAVKMGGADLTPQDVSLVRLFDAHNAELRRRLQGDQEKRDKAIAEANQAIEKAKRDYAKAEARFHKQYPVAAQFQDLKGPELVNKCWDIYILDCGKKGTVPVPRSNANLEIIKDQFQTQARDLHKRDYVRVPQNADAIVEYGKVKVRKLAKAGTSKAGNTFRNHLVIINPEIADEIPAVDEAGVDDENPDGDDPQDDQGDELPGDVPPEQGPIADAEEGDRRESRARNQRQSRKDKRKRAFTDAEQAPEKVPRTGDAGTSKHRHE